MKNVTKENKKKRLDAWQSDKEELSFKCIDQQPHGRGLKQGQIYICIVGENIGSEIRGPEPKGDDEISHARPALVISKEIYNTKGLVTVIPLTSSENLISETGAKGGNAPKIKVHYLLKKEKYDFLSKDSIVAPNQLKSISAIRLNKYLGCISEEDKIAIKSRLKSFFDM